MARYGGIKYKWTPKGLRIYRLFLKVGPPDGRFDSDKSKMLYWLDPWERPIVSRDEMVVEFGGKGLGFVDHLVSQKFIETVK